MQVIRLAMIHMEDNKSTMGGKGMAMMCKGSMEGNRAMLRRIRARILMEGNKAMVMVMGAMGNRTMVDSMAMVMAASLITNFDWRGWEMIFS
jgi:hypothetical protein